MATILIKFLLLIIAMTTVNSQDLRGQTLGLSRNNDNLDTSSSIQRQLLRQQQRNQPLSRIPGSQQSVRGGQQTSLQDQTDLQNPANFGQTRRGSRLSRPQSQQAQRDQFSLQKLQSQQLLTQQGLQQQRRQQKLQEQFQQQKLQTLQQQQRNFRLNNNPGTNRQDQRRQLNQQIGNRDNNGRFVQLSTGERERLTNQRGELDSQARPSERIPTFQSQRNLRQQRFLSGDDSRFGFSGQSNNIRSQQFPRGSFRPSFEPINGRFINDLRAQRRNPNQLSSLQRPMQQPFSQNQRGDDMLRQQQIEKERGELFMQQRKQQDDITNNRLLQQQEQQQIQQQREKQTREQLPVPGITDVGATLVKPKDVFVPTIDIASSVNNSSLKASDLSQIKRERIQQLADLLGFRPTELLNAVAELEASRKSLATNVIPAAQKATSLLINEGSTASPQAGVVPASWSGAASGLNFPLASTGPGFGSSPSVAAKDSAATAGAGSVVIDAAGSSAAGSVSITPAIGAATGSVALTPATGAATGSVALTPAGSSATGSVALDHATNVAAGPKVLDSAGSAPSGSVVLDPGASHVTGSTVLDSAATTVTGSTVPSPAASIGTGSLPLGVDSAGQITPTDWKLNELIRQMAVDLLSKRTQIFQMGQPSPNFVSNTTNQQTAAPDVTTALQSILTTQSPASTRSEGVYTILQDLISTTAVTSLSNHANQTTAATVTDYPLSSSPVVSREHLSVTVTSADKNLTDQNAQQDLATIVQNMLHTLITQTGTSGAMSNGTTFSVASKALLAEIQGHFSAMNFTTVPRNNSSPVSDNASSQPALNTARSTHLGSNTTDTTADNGTILTSGDMTLNGTDVLNVTNDVNATMTTPTMMTESLNTTIAIEVTEAVPTAPPPEPGFPHMYEALPGQELTEAQLEYNEMREGLMAR